MHQFIECYRDFQEKVWQAIPNVTIGDHSLIRKKGSKEKTMKSAKDASVCM